MACICGCDVDDHLHNLPSRPPSPNTFFENFWAPNFAELLTTRLRTVLDESEPSRRALWRRAHGGDAQDTIPSGHKWAHPPKFSDESRGTPISRLPTPNFDKIKDELWQIRLRFLADSKGFRKRPRPNNEDEGSQIPSPPAERSMHTSFSWPQRTLSSTLLSNTFDFDQPVPALTKKLITHSLPLQLSQAYPASNTPPFYGQHSQRPELYHGKRSHFRSPVSKAFRRPKPTKESRTSARCKAKAGNLSERLGEQAMISNGCLCGCGGDASYYLSPKGPRTSNTIYDSFWAPNFAFIIGTGLEGASAKLELSKRNWRGKEFDGTFLDSEILNSEIETVKEGNRGRVLRTSPLYHGLESRIEGRIQSSSKRQRSTCLPAIPISSPNLPVNAPPEAFTNRHDRATKVVPLDDTDEQVNKELANFWSILTSSRYTATRDPALLSKVRPPGTPTHYILDRRPQFKVPESSLIHPTDAKREPPTEEKLELLRPKLEIMRPRILVLASILIEAGMLPMVDRVLQQTFLSMKLDGLTESLLQAPSVHSKAKPFKSQLHYIPEKDTPLEILDFSEENPVQHKRKQLTQEEGEQLWELGPGKLEAMKDERGALYGISIERGRNSPIKSLTSTSSHDHIEEKPSDIYSRIETTAEELPHEPTIVPEDSNYEAEKD